MTFHLSRNFITCYFFDEAITNFLPIFLSGRLISIVMLSLMALSFDSLRRYGSFLFSQFGIFVVFSNFCAKFWKKRNGWICYHWANISITNNVNNKQKLLQNWQEKVWFQPLQLIQLMRNEDIFSQHVNWKSFNKTDNMTISKHTIIQRTTQKLQMFWYMFSCLYFFV